MSVTDELLRNNEHYAGSFTKGSLPLPPAKGVAVVACMDARLDLHDLLGLDEGDAHVIRNAGGAITEDAIRSLVISQRLLGTREIILIHHTDCGMLTFTDEGLKRDIQAQTGHPAPVRPRAVLRPRRGRASVDRPDSRESLRPAPGGGARLCLRRPHRAPPRGEVAPFLRLSGVRSRQPGAGRSRCASRARLALTQADRDTVVRFPRYPSGTRVVPPWALRSRQRLASRLLHARSARPDREELGTMVSHRRIARCLVAVAVCTLAFAAGASAEPWTRAYVAALPDEAFAVVHVRPDGSRSRHLPHHDADGRLDPSHLRSALARLGQVRWEDPADAERARRHLFAHQTARGVRWRSGRPPTDSRSR